MNTYCRGRTRTLIEHLSNLDTLASLAERLWRFARFVVELFD